MNSTQKIIIGLVVTITTVLLYLLKPILAPFLIAGFLAYLGDPLIHKLMRLKFPRTLAATLVFLLMMALAVSLPLFLIPLLSRQITLFLNHLPDMAARVQQFALPWIQSHFNLNTTLDLEGLKNIAAQHWQQTGNIAATVWQTLSHSGLAFIGWLAKLLIIPVVTFYLLRDWDQVVTNIKDLIPRKYEPTTALLANECNSVLSAFFRGQFLIMLILAVLYTFGLAIIGLDLALLLGVVAGLLAIVPYLGVTIGILSASIAALVQFHDWWHILYVAIIFIIGHFIEHSILTPWLVGDRIGLHPVAVIFAILAGGHLFGFLGVLLALPVAAVIMVLLRHLKQKYVGSQLYR